MKLELDEKEKFPFHIQLHLTNRCNLKCKHCYEGDRKSVEQWEYKELVSLVEQLEEAFSKWNSAGEISLVGGEPTLYPHLIDLMYRIYHSPQIERFAILTNGVHFSDELLAAIIETRPTIQISIDGTSEEMHDSIRGKGNYRKAIDNIRKLVSNDIQVFVHYVISKFSVPITWDFIQEMDKIGVSQITFSRDVPIGNSNDTFLLNKNEMHDTFNILNDYSVRLKQLNSNLKINTSRPLWACFGKSGRCPVGIQTLTILQNGIVYPCRRLPIEIGNIKTQTIFDIWYNSEVLWKLRERKNIKKCGSCEHLDDCGGARCIAFAMTGDFMSEDPQCWR